MYKRCHRIRHTGTPVTRSRESEKKRMDRLPKRVKKGKRKCIVPNCGSYQGDEGISLYGIPAVIKHQGDDELERSTARRRDWIRAIKVAPVNESRAFVCSRHFMTGKPSRSPFHVDWVPTVKMGPAPAGGEKLGFFTGTHTNALSGASQTITDPLLDDGSTLPGQHKRISSVKLNPILVGGKGNRHIQQNLSVRLSTATVSSAKHENTSVLPVRGMGRCCVIGCETKKDVMLHRFPLNDPVRMEGWLKICPPGLDVTNRSLRICCKHFRSEQYYLDPHARRPKLLKNAVPFLNVAVETTTRTRSSSSANHSHQQSRIPSWIGPDDFDPDQADDPLSREDDPILSSDLNDKSSGPTPILIPVKQEQEEEEQQAGNDATISTSVESLLLENAWLKNKLQELTALLGRMESRHQCVCAKCDSDSTDFS